MTLNEYQKYAHLTAIYPPEVGLEYTILGLCGEAGEIANKFKKTIRDKTDIPYQELESELGDVLWYVSQIAREIDTSLEDIAKQNLAKLERRQRENKLEGSGDSR